MAVRITLDLSTSDYESLSTSVRLFALSELQTQLLLTLLQLAYDRSAWQEEMTDEDWDTWDAVLSDLQEHLTIEV